MSAKAIWLQTWDGRKHRLQLSGGLQVVELRHRAAELLKAPAERVRLLYNGSLLPDEAEAEQLRPEGSVLAVALPLPPAKFSLSNSAPEDDDPVQLSFQLPQGASSFQRQLARLLRDKLKLPEFVLVLVFGVRPWVWLATAAWIFFAPIVAHYELGPLYVLGTICGLIFLNLGTRQAGEASAYSIFNQFRALPGQLTADEIDRQFRQGQM